MENKQGKINLGILITSIIAVILLVVIAIMGIYIANQNKIIEEGKIAIDNNENEIEQENAISDNTSTDISDDKILEMAKVTLDKYEKLLPFTSEAIGPMPYILGELGFEKWEFINNDMVDQNNSDRSEYIKTNIKYIDFKNEMLKYVTEEIFEKEFSHYKNMDGYVGVTDTAGDWPPSSISKIELISKDGNEYTFKVTYRDDEMYDHYLNGEDSETIEESECYYKGTVICKYINGYLVVSEDLGISE